MHFTVLSAFPLPQDISAASITIPVDDVVRFVEGRLLLGSLSWEKPAAMPKVDTTMTGAMRWECLVERMVADLLAPYDENNTDIAYMEFDNRTEEGRTAYEQRGVDCVKTPDGRIIPCHDYEFTGKSILIKRETKQYLPRTGKEKNRSGRQMISCAYLQNILLAAVLK